MAKSLKLRLGVSDDPTALQPSLNDCLEAMLGHADLLMSSVLQGLVLATASSGPHRIAGFQQGGIRQAIDAMQRDAAAVGQTYKAELSRVMYEGGGKEQVQTELLRFEDLQLFEDAQLDQSIEVARAQQEVSLAVDDVLPTVDALVSTLLGWRTIQPGLNPLRPELFVRALQATLACHVPEASVREALIAPAAGLLGSNLRRLYRELSDWLASTGVEPAVPQGGRLQQGSGATGAPVNDRMARTLLTLDKLRKLLAGDFDAPSQRPDFLHTVPASMAMLQDMQQVDVLVNRLQQRPRQGAAARGIVSDAPQTAPGVERSAPAQAPQAVQAVQAAQAVGTPAPPEATDGTDGMPQRLGQQLGDEVVRLMFDNLTQDPRLMPDYRSRLKAMEPAVHALARVDSRFFSDRNHPARQLLDRITQRSLAFSSQTQEGWPRFLASVDSAVQRFASAPVDADGFGELLDALQAQWDQQDQALRQRREDAARALLHAEQRNLLAQKLATEFAQSLEGLEVAEFIGDFLRGAWAQVVAEAQLSCTDGSDDPYGYRALVDDLIWSVQRSTARRGRSRRLAQMIPGLLKRLRAGLESIAYPPEMTARFFDNLITIHEAALQDGRDPTKAAAADALEAQPSQFGDSDAGAAMWLGEREAQESGYVDGDTLLPPEAAAPVELVHAVPPAGAPAEPAATVSLRTGTWVELKAGGEWTRVQLTWASPHATLFMFTSVAGTAHSMSRRTLDKLRSQGLMRVVAERNVVDEALDQVAQAALKNSLERKD